MSTTHSRHAPLAALCAALIALILAAAGAAAAETGVADAAAGSVRAPIVTIEGGAVRGVAVPGGYAYRGLPYAAAPTGQLRWRAPRPATDWNGVRDASQFAPSCPQQTDPFQNLFLPPGPIAEDCLYLNVSTPDLRSRRGDGRPVLVWIHGGGLTQDAARNYDGSKLAAEGTVVVTINYRLGALGFLAHPALAARPGGAAGNYGLMDQQAALRWVERNIEKFGGDPEQGDDRGPVGRWPVGARPPRLARLARALPAGDRAEWRVRADAAVPRRRQGVRPVVRDERGLSRPERELPPRLAGLGPR